jgi:hypothetical protein
MHNQMAPPLSPSSKITAALTLNSLYKLLLFLIYHSQISRDKADETAPPSCMHISLHFPLDSSILFHFNCMHPCSKLQPYLHYFFSPSRTTNSWAPPPLLLSPSHASTRKGASHPLPYLLHGRPFLSNPNSSLSSPSKQKGNMAAIQFCRFGHHHRDRANHQ